MTNKIVPREPTTRIIARMVADAHGRGCGMWVSPEQAKEWYLLVMRSVHDDDAAPAAEKPPAHLSPEGAIHVGYVNKCALCAPAMEKPAEDAKSMRDRVSDGSRQFPPHRDPGRVSVPMEQGNDDESNGRLPRRLAGESSEARIESGRVNSTGDGGGSSAEHDAGILRPQRSGIAGAGDAKVGFPLLFDNEWLRQHIDDDPPSCPHGVMAGACPVCMGMAGKYRQEPTADHAAAEDASAADADEKLSRMIEHDLRPLVIYQATDKSMTARKVLADDALRMQRTLRQAANRIAELRAEVETKQRGIESLQQRFDAIKKDNQLRQTAHMRAEAAEAERDRLREELARISGAPK